MTISQITPLLYQGPAPLERGDLSMLGIRVLVLCAEEFQPDAGSFPNVEVIHAPNDDTPTPTVKQLAIAHAAAKRVAAAMRQGKRVLVTCMMGWNRSGLVTALALHYFTRASGRECVAHVKEKRPVALRNPGFVAHLETIRSCRGRRVA